MRVAGRVIWLKKCLRCGVEKDESEFYKDKKQNDGLKIYCKECVRKWNSENKERLNAQKRRYAIEHSDVVKQSQKNYRQTHKNKVNEYQALKQTERREWVRSFKTPCVKCGENRFYVIDYHHIDYTEKNFALGTFSKGWHTKEELLQEIAKCVCLCRNCHAEYHWLYGINPEHPIETLSEYVGCDVRCKTVKTDGEVCKLPEL